MKTTGLQKTRPVHKGRAILVAALLVLLWCSAACGASTGASSTHVAKHVRRTAQSADASGEFVSSVSMVGAGEGWAVAGGRLLWTNTNGESWSDITPAGADIADGGVSFLNSQYGWVVDSDQYSVTVYRTSDGGADWQVSSTTVTRQTGGGASLTFMSPSTGWIDVPVVSSSNWPTGLLLKTVDGGRTWTDDTPRQIPPGFPFASGPIEFVSSTAGYLVGGPTNQLYESSDSGLSWSVVSLSPPSGYAGATVEASAPPTVVGSDLVLPATLVRGNGAPTVQAFYVSTDQGASWAAAASSNSAAGTGDAFLPSFVGADNWYFSPGGSALIRYPASTPTQPGAPVSENVLPIAGGGEVTSIEFASPSDGWALVRSESCASKSGGCSAVSDLETTSNGGATWTVVAVPVASPTDG